MSRAMSLRENLQRRQRLRRRRGRESGRARARPSAPTCGCTAWWPTRHYAPPLARRAAAAARAARPPRRRRCRSRRRDLRGLLGLGRVALEEPRRRELAELVADHVLGDVHRDELLPVVHRDRVPDHLRDHGRAPRPGLDDLLLVLAIHRLHLLEQVEVDERPLLQ